MPVVNTSQTFATGDTVTSTTLNNIMDQSVFVAGAVVSGSGLAITAGGQMTTSNIPGANITNTSITGGKLASSTITSTNLANSSVTNTKIADNAVTTLKIANLNVTTDKIADADITAPKLSGAQTGTAPIYGARAWAKLNPYIGSIRTGAYKSGDYSRSTSDTTVTIVNHGLKTNDKIRLNFTSGTATDGLYTVLSSANANEFVVNHSGSATTGEVTAEFVAIQRGGNISTASWYDSGDARIVLNFQTPMPNDDYVISATGQHYPGEFNSWVSEDTLGTTQLNTIYQAHVYINYGMRFSNVVIFG